MADADPDDERRHEPGEDELWNESYYLDWFSPDGSMGGYLRVGFMPNLGQCWYWACLVESGGPLVTVLDHEVAAPRSSSSLELRHDGLWADHHVAEPLQRMTASLESFAVELDDPLEVYGGARGTRVPFGFELEWETTGTPYQWPMGNSRYEIPCAVSGEVLVGDRRIEVDGWGQRDHSWGDPRPWWTFSWHWSAGRLEDGTRWHTSGSFPGLGDFAFGYLQRPDGTTPEDLHSVVMDLDPGSDGLVAQATMRFAGMELAVTPVAWSPVPIDHPDGPRSHFDRALASFEATDGRRGHGWIEWNRPPAH